MYVPANRGQLLAFAAKVAEAMIIPQLTAFISIYSTRRAIQVGFFSSFSNVFSILTDPRSWTHVRRIPKLSTTISATSWIVIWTSLILWLSILVSDLLVFQLSPTRYQFTFSPDFELKFKSNVTEVPGSGSTTLRAPTALLSTTEAIWDFKNSTYIPFETYRYLHQEPRRLRPAISNGTDTIVDFEVPAANSYTCYATQQMRDDYAANGVAGTQVSCSTNGYPVSEYFPPTIGFNKAAQVQAYQGLDGAYFSVMSPKQRIVSILGEKTKYPVTVERQLNQLTQGYTLISQYVNSNSFFEDVKSGLDTLVPWTTSSDIHTVSFLYYNITEDTAYDREPRFTYNYISIQVKAVGYNYNASTSDTFERYMIPGAIYFSYLTYSSRNIHVPDAMIDPRYLSNFGDMNGLLSPIIQTDLPDEHIIIAMLDHPQTPLRVKVVLMMSAWPAVLLIAFSGGVALFLFLLVRVYRLFGGKVHHFDAYLEICHKAVDDSQHRSADSLIVKMQDTDLIMVDGFCPRANGNKMGLVPASLEIVTLDKKKVYV